MRTLSGRRVLVTGAAAGIGQAIAARFARAGAHVLLADLDQRQLDAATAGLAREGATVTRFPVDVTDLPSVQALRARVHAEAGPIDALVNNAGVVFGGAFLDVPIERHRATYLVNAVGVVAMTHTFLPDLIARPDTHVVNVASASGFVGLPFGSTYASSKWAVIGFSESLRLELDLLGHRHVHVTTVCPGYVTTGLFAGARAPRLMPLLSADRLADRIAAAVLRDAAWLRTPWLVQVTPFLKGVLPARVFYGIAAALGVSTSMTGWTGRPRA